MAFNWERITRDFQQKYQDTYIRVRFKHKPDTHLFYVRSVQQREECPTLELVNKEFGTIMLNYSTDCELSFEYPSTGYFFYDGKVALLGTRQFTRQWKRGLCGQTYKIGSPYYNLAFGLSNYFRVDEGTLAAAFMGQQIPSLDQANELLRSALSVPLTDKFALGLCVCDAKEYMRQLWYLDTPIGFVNMQTREITLKDELFEQEVHDYLVRERLDYAIRH